MQRVCIPFYFVYPLCIPKLFCVSCMDWVHTDISTGPMGANRCQRHPRQDWASGVLTGETTDWDHGMGTGLAIDCPAALRFSVADHPMLSSPALMRSATTCGVLARARHSVLTPCARRFTSAPIQQQLQQTNVVRTGGLVAYQLLCGREIANPQGATAQQRAVFGAAQSMANWVYLVVDTGTGIAVAVDAAWDVAALYALADALGVRLVGCAYTHAHFDHIGGGVDAGKGEPVMLPGAREIMQRGGQVCWGAHVRARGVRDVVNCCMSVCARESPDAHTTSASSAAFSAIEKK